MASERKSPSPLMKVVVPRTPASPPPSASPMLPLSGGSGGYMRGASEKSLSSAVIASISEMDNDLVAMAVDEVLGDALLTEVSPSPMQRKSTASVTPKRRSEMSPLSVSALASPVSSTTSAAAAHESTTSSSAMRGTRRPPQPRSDRRLDHIISHHSSTSSEQSAAKAEAVRFRTSATGHSESDSAQDAASGSSSDGLEMPSAEERAAVEVVIVGGKAKDKSGPTHVRRSTSPITMAVAPPPYKPISPLLKIAPMTAVSTYSSRRRDEKTVRRGGAHSHSHSSSHSHSQKRNQQRRASHEPVAVPKTRPMPVATATVEAMPAIIEHSSEKRMDEAFYAVGRGPMAHASVDSGNLNKQPSIGSQQSEADSYKYSAHVKKDRRHSSRDSDVVHGSADTVVIHGSDALLLEAGDLIVQNEEDCSSSDSESTASAVSREAERMIGMPVPLKTPVSATSVPETKSETESSKRGANPAVAGFFEFTSTQQPAVAGYYGGKHATTHTRTSSSGVSGIVPPPPPMCSPPADVRKRAQVQSAGLGLVKEGTPVEEKEKEQHSSVRSEPLLMVSTPPATTGVPMSGTPMFVVGHTADGQQLYSTTPMASSPMPTTPMAGVSMTGMPMATMGSSGLQAPVMLVCASPAASGMGASVVSSAGGGYTHQSHGRRSKSSKRSKSKSPKRRRSSKKRRRRKRRKREEYSSSEEESSNESESSSDDLDDTGGGHGEETEMLAKKPLKKPLQSSVAVQLKAEDTSSASEEYVTDSDEDSKEWKQELSDKYTYDTSVVFHNVLDESGCCWTLQRVFRMDGEIEQCYRQILEIREEHPMEKVKGFSLQNWQLGIRVDLSRTKTVWFDSFWMDYLFHLRNTHSLFGVALHHGLHPYNWPLRICVLMLSLCVSMWFYAAFQVENKPSKTVTFTWALLQLGVVWSLKKLARCPCVQQMSDTKRRFVTCMTHFVIFLFGIVSMLLFAAFFYYLFGIYKMSFFGSYVRMILTSWLFWEFVLPFFYVIFKYWKEKWHIQTDNDQFCVSVYETNAQLAFRTHLTLANNLEKLDLREANVLPVTVTLKINAKGTAELKLDENEKSGIESVEITLPRRRRHANSGMHRMFKQSLSKAEIRRREQMIKHKRDLTSMPIEEGDFNYDLKQEGDDCEGMSHGDTTAAAPKRKPQPVATEVELVVASDRKKKEKEKRRRKSSKRKKKKYKARKKRRSSSKRHKRYASDAPLMHSAAAAAVEESDESSSSSLTSDYSESSTESSDNGLEQRQRQSGVRTPVVFVQHTANPSVASSGTGGYFPQAQYVMAAPGTGVEMQPLTAGKPTYVLSPKDSMRSSDIPSVPS